MKRVSPESAGIGSPARRPRDGTVPAGGHNCDVELDGLPPGRDIAPLAGHRS